MKGSVAWWPGWIALVVGVGCTATPNEGFEEAESSSDGSTAGDADSRPASTRSDGSDGSAGSAGSDDTQASTGTGSDDGAEDSGSTGESVSCTPTASWAIASVIATEVPNRVMVDALDRTHVVVGTYPVLHRVEDADGWHEEELPAISDVVAMRAHMDELGDVHVVSLQLFPGEVAYYANVGGEWAGEIVGAYALRYDVDIAVAGDVPHIVGISGDEQDYVHLYPDGGAWTHEVLAPVDTSDPDVRLRRLGSDIWLRTKTYGVAGTGGNMSSDIRKWTGTGWSAPLLEAASGYTVEFVVAEGPVYWALQTTAADTWLYRYPPLDQGVQWTDAAQPSIAADATGNLHVAYFDDHEPRLYYATNASGAWVAAVVDDSAQVGDSPTIAVGPTGLVRIAYTDLTNGRIMLAQQDCAE